MKRALLALMLILIFGILACSQNTSKETAEDTLKEDNTQTSQSANSGLDAQNPDPHAGLDMSDSSIMGGGSVERKIVVPEEVEKTYKSLILEVIDNSSGATKSIEREVLIGQRAEISGTNLDIEVEYYLPDFYMEQNGLMSSKSANEKNPAAKVKIYENNSLIFDGWLFKNFPGIHSFQHPVYDIRLKDSTKK